MKNNSLLQSKTPRPEAGKLYQNLHCYRGLDRYENVQITCSGGRTSAYQLLHIAEANGGVPKNCMVMFNNTGHELDATLDFVHEIEKFLGIDIHWTEYDPDAEHKAKRVNYETASRDGEPFRKLFSTPIKRRDGTVGLRPLPNPAQRICTSELKIKLSHRYLTKILGWRRDYRTVYGFRADEQRRVDRKLKLDAKGYKLGVSGPLAGVELGVVGGLGLFPMFEAQADVDDVMAFWEKMPFDLGIPSAAGNCDFCLMKSSWKIKELMQQYPEKVPAWIEYEEMPRDRNNRFRSDRKSMREIWNEVQAGNMDRDPDDKQLFCGTCTDW